jgi:hypothetical protein
MKKFPLAKMEAALKQFEASLNVLNNQVNNMKDHKDSLSDLGEEQKQRMRKVMEEMAKADQLVSKITKKFSETAGQIIRNIK